MVRPLDIAPATFAARLLDPDDRRALFAALEREQGTSLPLTHAYAEAGRSARATGDELRRIVELLLAEGRARWVDDLVFHPDLPDDVLLELCDRSLCVSALGHRAGPRWLLQRIVELHAYPEAILTLALDLYRDPTVPAAEFTAFARPHAGLEWMLRTLAGVDGSDAAKEAAFEALLGGSPEATASRALHLARTEGRSARRFENFVTTHGDPSVLVALLRSETLRVEQRAIVCRVAEAHRDDTRVAAALGLDRAREMASAPNLTQELAAALLAAGVPEVLRALAGNLATPREILERLTDQRGTPGARAIRGLASETLRALRR